METTRATLLARLKERHEAAWEEFFHLYASPIRAFARKLGLGPADAQDVVQETAVAMMLHLPRFTYEPGRGRFRNYLLTIARHQCYRAMQRERRAPLPCAEPPDLPDEEAALPWEAVNRSWEEALAEVALDRLLGRLRVRNARTREVFLAYALRGEAAGEVAARFGLKENAVYQIRNRLWPQWEKELAAFRFDEPSGGSAR